MVEQEQDYKIDVWTPEGKRRALDMFFDDTLPAGAIDKLSEVERCVFMRGLKADGRTYSTLIVDGTKGIYHNLDNQLPESVPRDGITKIFLAAATAAYVVDSWDPIPIGETVAAIFLGAAAARGVYLNRKNKEKSDQNPDQNPDQNNDDDHPKI